MTFRWKRHIGTSLLLSVILFAGCLAPASSNPGEKASAEQSSRPNILFVFTDDHATDAIGAYEGRLSEVASTPNIDRLAEEGMLFRNAFVTNSICAPSRAVILTGRHSHLNGIRGNGDRFDGDQPTFPALLRDAGYQTAIVGKWHLKSDPEGFDYWEVLPGQGLYYNPEFRTPEGRKKYDGYVTNVITDRALRWLREERDPDRPFVLMYQHKAPHRNWLPDEKHVDLYDDTEIPEPTTLFDDYSGRTPAAREQEMTIARHFREGWDLKLPGGEDWDRIEKQTTDEQLSTLRNAYADENEVYESLEGRERVRWNYQRYMKDYLRTIASVDENLGHVLDYLEDAGLADNTIVVYSSDQGFFLGDHGWYDKRWMYEESLRMPLIVRWPGVTRPGSEDEHLVQNLDFAPTFLEMAGADIPAEVQGESLASILAGESPPDWRDAIYYQYFEFPRPHRVAPHYGVRTDRYKLIYFNTMDEWELYDLAEDPEELHSLYGRPGYEEITARLEEKLDSLRREYEVPQEPAAP